MQDFSVRDEGSVFVVSPLTVAGHEWAEENLPVDAMKWAGGVVVGAGYVQAILEGIHNDGLSFVN